VKIAAGFMSTDGPHRFERRPGFPYWTMACVQQGRRSLTLAGRPALRRDRYDFTMIEPDTPYLTESQEALVEHIYVFFLPRPDCESLMNWTAVAPGIRSVRAPDDASHQRLYRAMLLIYDSFQAPHPDQEALAYNALQRSLLVAQPLLGAVGRAQPRDARIVEALGIIESHCTDGAPAIAELARRLGMSPSHFAHLFAREVGIPPARYIESRRIRRAQELLLTTDRAIKTIADALGYSNPFHFTARFTRWVGKSPRAFRASPL